MESIGILEIVDFSIPAGSLRAAKWSKPSNVCVCGQQACAQRKNIFTSVALLSAARSTDVAQLVNSWISSVPKGR